MGGIYVDFSVVNQLNSPALNSNTFANRPAAGQIGRLFISTDTFEIYRDNGTTWDLIGGPGTSTITGTGTAGNFPIFTSSQVIGNSEMYYTEGANFNNINFGYTGPGAKYATTELNIFSNNESRIFLQFDSNKYAQLSNEFGNVYLGANNSGIHGFNNVFYYNGSSAADRYLSFQTESLDRLTIEQNGDIQLNKYTTDGFLRTSGANGTLSIDTNTYVTDNIYTADGTLAAARTVNLNNHNLRFEGGANTARLRLSANNNVARIFSFATADVARWAFRIDGNETGSNAGANFALRRYNDAGTFIDAPIVVNRATGHVGIGPGLQQLETFNVTGSSLFSHSYTQGNDFNRKGVFAFLNTTTNSGAAFTNGYNYNAITGLHWDNFSANTTIPNGVTIGGTYSGGQVGFDTINTTVTLAQGSGGGLRTFSGSIAQIALAAPTTGGVVTHASGFQALAPYYIGANLPTITNYFGVAINDSTEYSSVAITNRWGIYQNGSTDRNYLNGNTLIGSNVDNGNKLQVTGQATISGNVGIGTSSPASFLHIGTYGTAGRYIDAATLPSTPSNYLITLAPPSTTNYYGGGIGWSEGTNTAAAINAYDDGAGGALGLSIATGSNSAITERMRITSGGNVGIGTASPNTTLEVNKTITFSSIDDYAQLVVKTTAGANGHMLNIGVDNANGLSFIQSVNRGTAQTPLILQRYNGNVGIGTTTPDTNSRLDVNGQLFAARFTMYNDNGTPSIGTSPMLYSPASGTMAFSTNSAERIRITSGGNVLIGTTTDAGFRLDVNGSFNALTSGISLEYNNGILYHAGGSGNYYQYISGANYNIINRTATGALILGTSDTERMRIKSGGQVRFVPLASDPGGAESGDVYYNSGTNKLRLYDGTNWVDLN